jgi:ABC-type molybdate transport system substrate-binding protein
MGLVRTGSPEPDISTPEAVKTALVNARVIASPTKLVGPLPEPIQRSMTYSAAIAQSSADSEAARAFVAALTAPDMRDRRLKAGWQPAN